MPEVRRGRVDITDNGWQYTQLRSPDKSGAGTLARCDFRGFDVENREPVPALLDFFELAGKRNVMSSPPPPSDHLGFLPPRIRREVFELDRGYGDMDIDAVHERPGNARHVTLDFRRSAVAFMGRVAVITARAGIHSRDEHEPGRISDSGRSAGYRNLVVLHGLPQHFEDILFEFGQFIQEEDAVMRERNLAGFRNRPPTNQPCV